MPSLEQVIRESVISVVNGRYAVAKVRDIKNINSHFAICQDETETTVITAEEFLSEIEPIAMETWFKLIEIRVSQPFGAPGFLATASTAIARFGVNVFIVSTFSKDYILLRENDLGLGLRALDALGFKRAE